ncbi:MAG: RDD family protein [Chloroflexota bacterium]
MIDLTSRPPLAGILVRFGAVLLDGLIPGLIFIPVGLAASFLVQNPANALADPTTTTILLFLVLLTYFGLSCYSALVLAMWAYGLTPGKWMLGIRVIKSDTGLPAGFWRMALRQIIGQWVAQVLCFLGLIWAIFDANKQGWHDKIAKTLVIRTR